MSEPLEQQIAGAIRTYAEKAGAPPWVPPDKLEALRLELMVAMLSGISLTANFLAANDGATIATPQNMMDAAIKVAATLDLGMEPLSG